MSNFPNIGPLHPRDYGLGGRGSHLAIPSIIGPILAAILVFNRLYWRMTLLDALGRDDLCILASLIFLFALCIVNLVAVDHGFGRPAAELSDDEVRCSLQMFYLDQIFYKFTINLTKLSVLVLYLRIFSQRWFRLTCLACIFLVVLYTTASVLATIFQCTPVSFAWDKTTTPYGRCISYSGFWYANAIYNLSSELVVLLSVPGVVWSLHLPVRQRWALTFVFGLGVFVFATSVLRLTTLDVSSKTTDPTAGTLVSTIWTTIEASCAVVCACLPMVRTPLQRYWPRLFGGSTTARRSRSRSVGDGDTTIVGGSSGSAFRLGGVVKKTSNALDSYHGFDASNTSGSAGGRSISPTPRPPPPSSENDGDSGRTRHFEISLPPSVALGPLRSNRYHGKQTAPASPTFGPLHQPSTAAGTGSKSDDLPTAGEIDWVH